MKINPIKIKNFKLKMEVITFAFYIFLLRLKSNFVYTLLLILFASIVYKFNSNISEMILGMVLTLIIFNSINQHYQEYKFRELTRQIKANIFSSYFCVYEIFCILTNNFSEEIRNIQNETIVNGTKILNNMAKTAKTNNTIDISKNNLCVLRSYVENLQQNIKEAITLTKMLGVDFEIYDVVQELDKFNEIITINIHDTFDKKNSSPLELIFGDLNNSFLKNLVENYAILLMKLENNTFLKHIVFTANRPVFTAPCEIPLTEEQAITLNKRLKEKQNL